MTPPLLKSALDDLAAFIKAGRPYLDQVVLVGGWVPYFYRHLPDLQDPGYDPILTADFDLAAPERVGLANGQPLDALLRNGDFVAVGAVDPPLLRYQRRRRGETQLAPVHFEFLAPLTGRDTTRSGETRAVAELQEGLSAQLLRHLDLLLHQPLEIDTGQVPLLDVSPEATLRIANPAAYLIQKGLIQDQRRGGKASKDLAYLYEVALLWSGQEPRVRAMTDALAGEAPLWRRRVREGGTALAKKFADEDAEGPVLVAKEIEKAGVSPASDRRAIFRIVRPFLESALGVERQARA